MSGKDSFPPYEKVKSTRRSRAAASHPSRVVMSNPTPQSGVDDEPHEAVSSTSWHWLKGCDGGGGGRASVARNPVGKSNSAIAYLSNTDHLQNISNRRRAH